MTQLAFDTPAIPEHRVVALGKVLAGFRWPERQSWERLSKTEQTAALGVARDALEALARS